jgi:hypothetical protein
VKDRRQFARAKVKWPVTILSPEQKSPGEIESISHSGARIYSQELPLPGQKLSLEIQPSNHQSFCVIAKTVWGIIADSPKKPYRFVIGVQFEDISEDDIQFISEIVSK